MDAAAQQKKNCFECSNDLRRMRLLLKNKCLWNGILQIHTFFYNGLQIV